MLAWLALLIAQPTLVTRDNLARHRQLGRIGGLLAIFITGLGIFTGIASLVLNRFPPFFTPPHFLALTVTESLVFGARSEEHTSELQSLMRISYAVFCLKKKNNTLYAKQSTITLSTQLLQW